MAKGYWIAHVDVEDAEGYKSYLATNGKAFASFGARFIVRGGHFDNPEGTSRSRNIVLEFPSYQAALDCYHSQEYAEPLAIRKRTAITDIIIIEGYEGPQPTG